MSSIGSGAAPRRRTTKKKVAMAPVIAAH